jgi:hypothetical protein
MCFSASASFTAGVLLTFVGAETLRKVHKPSQIIFAGIPLFFAFQQFTEGVIWLAIRHTGYLGVQTVFTYIFIIMAQVLWPILIPLSVLLLEENTKRKRILFALLIVGIAIGSYYLYRTMIYDIYAEVSSRHIVYQGANQDPLIVLAMFFYVTATIVPLFVSSTKRTYILGIIMGASFIVSAVYYMKCLTSVWCFFAAVISFVIYYIVRDSHKKFHFGTTVKA